MVIENAGKSKWPEALPKPSLTVFTGLIGPERTMNTVCGEVVSIGKAKNLHRGFFG
jgi:hypothetical protein